MKDGDLTFIIEKIEWEYSKSGRYNPSASLDIRHPRGEITVKHSTDLAKGNNGAWYHIKLSNGTILRSDNVWNLKHHNPTHVAEADELCIGDVDPMGDCVVELGCDGELLSSADKVIQDAKMQEAHNAERKRRIDLLKEVCRWNPETCHNSVKIFRTEAAQMFFYEVRDLHLCRCGILCALRQIKKRKSINSGQMFYGCRLFPSGCGHYSNVQKESDERSRIFNKVTNPYSSRCSKKDANRLATLTGHGGDGGYTAAIMHGQFRKRNY